MRLLMYHSISVSHMFQNGMYIKKIKLIYIFQKICQHTSVVSVPKLLRVQSFIDNFPAAKMSLYFVVSGKTLESEKLRKKKCYLYISQINFSECTFQNYELHVLGHKMLLNLNRKKLGWSYTLLHNHTSGN